ncbi:MAG TPA: hypothetical protein VI894_03785 [Candidatus Nanoarchaeia archaeon]|nr:hypothetical protein [Candidatus Nanoarchaeia archaeon]
MAEFLSMLRIPLQQRSLHIPHSKNSGILTFNKNRKANVNLRGKF